MTENVIEHQIACVVSFRLNEVDVVSSSCNLGFPGQRFLGGICDPSGLSGSRVVETYFQTVWGPAVSIRRKRDQLTVAGDGWFEVAVNQPRTLSRRNGMC